MLIIVHLCSLRLPAAINYTYIVLTLLSNPSLPHHPLPHFPFPLSIQIHRHVPGDSLKVLQHIGHGHGSHPWMVSDGILAIIAGSDTTSLVLSGLFFFAHSNA